MKADVGPLCRAFLAVYAEYADRSGRSAAARRLRSWVRIPPREWMPVVSFVCCRVEICDELIPRPEEFYRLWCVVVCDLETS